MTADLAKCCVIYSFCHMRGQLFIDLQNEINSVSQNQLLLYGSESFSVPINTFILQCSINYIMNTGRFHGLFI